MAYQDIIANFMAQQAAANRANQIRYAQALKLYDQIVEQYQPGGGFGAGWEAQLGRQKTKDVASGEQSLVSGGLFGTTVTAGLPKKWEEEVGQPARLKLEDIRMERLSGALQAKAGLIERREDVGPDYSMIAQLASQAAQTPQSTYGEYEPFPQATESQWQQPTSTGAVRGTAGPGPSSGTAFSRYEGKAPVSPSVAAYAQIEDPPPATPSAYQYAPWTPSQQIQQQYTPQPLQTYQPRYYA